MTFAPQQSLDSTVAATSAEWNVPDRQAPATAFSSSASPWSDLVADRLVQLLRLPAGWDGHNARPISRTLVDYACHLLPRLVRPGVPAPFVAPLATGGLQLEWHRNGWDLEIEIEAPGRLYVYVREVATDQESEFDLTDDLRQLQPKLDAIRN